MNESPRRALVIDDEPAIRRYLRATLSAHSYNIFEAGTGQDGINAVITHRPDIIVLDLGLPDISGLAVTQQLREWSQVPIIVLSVQDQEAEGLGRRL